MRALTAHVSSRRMVLQREVLMKELERERRLRIDAENRLRDERLDVCDCKSQATELQKELTRLSTVYVSL